MRFDKLNKISSRLVLVLSLIFSIIIVASNVLFIGKDIVEGKAKYIFLSFIIVISISALALSMIKIKKNKCFLLLLFLVSFLIRFIWIIAVDTQPVSDFFIMYDAAIKIVEGNKDVVFNDLYFSSWVYQLGFTTYLVFLYKLFSGSLFLIKLINVLIVSFIPIVIYKIVEKLISEKCARVAGVLYSLYFSSIAYTSTLTNQHITTLLCYIAVYFLLTKFNKKWTFILVGVLIGVAHIIRPEGSLLLLAIFLFMLFKDLTLDKQYFIKMSKTISMIVIFSLIIKMFSVFLISLGLTQYEFGNRNPLWKLVTGLNYESGGSYSEEDNTLLYYVPAGEEKNKMEMKLIKERLSNPKKVVYLFAKKTVAFWGANDNSFSFIYTDAEEYEKYNDISVAVEKMQYFIISIFFMIGVWELYKRKEFTNSHFFLILFLGYVFTYIIIEIQIRYRYFIIPLLVIIASYGINKLYLRRVYIKSKNNVI